MSRLLALEWDAKEARVVIARTRGSAVAVEQALAIPLPQREAGARQTLRYIGELLADGTNVLIFPEGRRSESGVIDVFRPGIGMIASRLGAPVVPVRLGGLQDVLRVGWKMARPGRVRVAFGAPLRLVGDDYEALARKVEAAVKGLVASGKTYEKDGALWLRTTDYGDDKDRVVRKSDGSYTYFVPDVAYHVTKWQRGFAKVIDVQGTDHHSTVTRVRAGLQAIPKGQYEGAMAVGLGYWQMMYLIVLPQALKITIPNIVNTYIGLFKDTTLVVIVGIFDFLRTVEVSRIDPKWAAPTTSATGYAFAAMFYFIFCYAMSRYAKSVEARLAKGDRR